jgi:hypothetical protein
MNVFGVKANSLKDTQCFRHHLIADAITRHCNYGIFGHEFGLLRNFRTEKPSTGGFISHGGIALSWQAPAFLSGSHSTHIIVKTNPNVS